MDDNTLQAVVMLGYFATLAFVLWLAFNFARPNK